MKLGIRRMNAVRREVRQARRQEKADGANEVDGFGEIDREDAPSRLTCCVSSPTPTASATESNTARAVCANGGVGLLPTYSVGSRLARSRRRRTRASSSRREVGVVRCEAIAWGICLNGVREPS